MLEYLVRRRRQLVHQQVQAPSVRRDAADRRSWTMEEAAAAAAAAPSKQHHRVSQSDSYLINFLSISPARAAKGPNANLNLNGSTELANTSRREFLKALAWQDTESSQSCSVYSSQLYHGRKL